MGNDAGQQANHEEHENSNVSSITFPYNDTSSELSALAITQLGNDAGQQANHEEHENSTNYFKLPNIQLVGAQKAGTSAVSKWLFNEGVCEAAIFHNESSYFDKEAHFFDMKDRFRQGIEFYVNRFLHCKGQEFTMDATPNYFLHPKNVHATYYEAGGNQHDQLKIILIVRDPAARELSLYNHMVDQYTAEGAGDNWFNIIASKGEVLGFDEYVDSVLKINLAQKSRGKESFYGDNLEEWTKYFARDQILVLSYDELHMTPELTQRRVRGFLGVDAADFSGKISVSNSKKSPLKVHDISCATQAKLNEIFEGENDKLYQFLDKNPGPLMEQSPFPSFQEANCTEVSVDGNVSSTTFPINDTSSELSALATTQIGNDDGQHTNHEEHENGNISLTTFPNNDASSELSALAITQIGNDDGQQANHEKHENSNVSSTTFPNNETSSELPALATTQIGNDAGQQANYEEHKNSNVSSTTFPNNDTSSELSALAITQIVNDAGQQANYEEHENSTNYFKLPNIQLVGAQKAGTSAVSKWL